MLVLNASAQQSTPLLHVQLGMPVTPPRGWDPKMWADLRAHCQGIADRSAAGMPYASRQEMEDGKSVCMTGVPWPTPATSPSRATTPEIGIPEQAPPTWSQEAWTARRQHCVDLFEEASRRRKMTPEQRRASPPLQHEEFESCYAMVQGPAPAPRPPSTSLPEKPLATPTPTAGVSLQLPRGMS